MCAGIAAATTGALLVSPPAAAAVTTGVSASQLAAAISAQPGLVAAASYVPLASPIAVAVSDDLVGGMPRHGSTFGIMSSGSASILTDANTSGSSSTSLGNGPLKGNSAYDVTVLKVDLDVPSGANCLSFDFRFLSEEYPEYVGSSYNDAFLAEVLVAELGSSTWTTSGSSISAPDNFAFDPEGNPITINAAGVTSMSSAEAMGTTYDGATPLLVASTPVTPGRHPLYLSIFDQGDTAFDSAVLLDNLRSFTAPSSALCRPGAALAGNGTPNWDDFHAGDVHVHAAGDTNLAIHPRCEGYTERECAQYMVQNVFDRAKRFGSEWLVFTEHAAWLGFQRDANFELYSSEQANRQWLAIKEALDDQSRTQIRGLLGEELGTAIPACTDVDVDMGTKLVPFPPFVVPTIDGYKLSSPGHYGVYQTDGFINASMVDCNETGENGYADDTEEIGGWGGINHPDNKDGGSPWHCFSTDSSGDGRESQPQMGRYEECPVGLDRYGVKSVNDTGSFRTMEIMNADNLPSAKTLGLWDMYLQNGFRVSAVGGGDGHTAPRKQNLAGAAKCLVRLGPGPLGTDVGECVDQGSAPSDANHNKVGGTARTVAHYPAADGAVGTGYDSTNPNDPARRSLLSGSTLATNGPIATAQVNGQYPGAEVSLPGNDPVELRVDWQSGWTSVGDTVGQDQSKIPDSEFDVIPGTGQKSVRFDGRTPDRIVVVTGDTDGCGWNRFHCASSTHRRTISIVDGGTSAEGVTIEGTHANVLMDPPADGYVRVELYWDEPEDGTNPIDTHSDSDDGDRPRYYNNRLYDFAAFTSPIYVERSASVTIQGKVVDGVTGNPVSGAGVEFCRTGDTFVCVTRTTRPDGTWVPVVSKTGTWTARAFPPAGVTNRGVGSASIGTLLPNAVRNVTISLPEMSEPPYIDPSGTVVDTDGNPISGATVRLAVSPTMDGPYTLVPDGSVLMSPANRTNPGITGDAGTFAWDVLAGWYTVEATKPGCTGVDGGAGANTGPLQIPPPALGLELVLDCRTPDTVAPTMSVSGVPSGFTASPDLSVAVSVTDTSPAAALCLLDGGPEVDMDGTMGETPATCGETFEATGLADGPHTLTVIAVDDRGNQTIDEWAFTVDTTAPSITVAGVTAGETYPPSAPPTPSCTATDAGSGVAGSCEGVLTSPPDGVGQWSYTATATDNVGNKATKTVTWQVGALFAFDGFYSPVPAEPEVLSAQAGRAIPVRFSLGGPQGMDVIATGYPRSGSVACDSNADTVDMEEAETPGASGLSYDPGSDTYMYVWKTSTAWKGTCRRFVLKLTDGTVHRFSVVLR
ncbi:MAG TPA: PxKF domain-containing protein [Frankiaceae bacterium]|nr:PxKF domain-containing protein [Frankiaceae bacterium]